MISSLNFKYSEGNISYIMSQKDELNLKLYLDSQFAKQNMKIGQLLTDGESLTVSDKHDYTTKTEMDTSYSLGANTYWRFLRAKGTGIIDQLFIYNDQNDYKIKITIDDSVLFNGDQLFSWFETYDDWLDNLSAFSSGAYYVFSIRNLYFSENFTIELTGGTATTLTVALCKYTIREGRELK